MKEITRTTVMFQGVLKKKDRSILIIKEKEYKISDVLSKKLRLKNFLLGAETFILTWVYLLNIEKFRDIPFKGADPAVLTEGLALTFLFLFAVAGSFLVTSLLLIPEDISLLLEELDEDF